MTTFAITVHCPDWCLESGRAAHREGRDIGTRPNGAIEVSHQGPAYGGFSCFGDVDLDDGQLVLRVGFDEAAYGKVDAELDGTRSPKALRRLAADAKRAAKWLEAH